MAKLSLLDTAFLALETEASPKHVAGLGIFEPIGKSPDLRELIADMKTVPAQEPFNQKLNPSLVTLPSWVEDTDIDFDWHVRHVALPKPGSIRDLMEYVARLHSTLLDRSRPLWEFYLIEGLEGGCFATYFKIHHAYMDGVTLSKRIVDTFGEDSGHSAITPIWGLAPEKRKVRNEEQGLLTQLTDSLRSAGVIANALPELGSLAVDHSLKVLGFRKDGLPIPFTAPRTRLNEKLSPAREAGVAKLDLVRVKRVAKTAGVTVNDVLLSIVDGGLLAYLDSIGESADEPLVAQMPISVRSGPAKTAGNQITIAQVALATVERDPVARLQRIHENAAEVKEQYGRMSEWTASTYTVILQTIAQIADLAKADRFMQPLGNIVISNVIGDPAPKYLAGAKAVGMYPISTIAPGLSANITSFTCGGEVNIGMIAGREAIGDAMFVTSSMVDSFLELEAALGLKPRAKMTTKKKRKKTARKSSAGA